ncbi:MAG: inorganic diphosphatase [Polyangiaceae bacterium]|nr:inorganic diphosphatase [Polyangiaceae bacterium]
MIHVWHELPSRPPSPPDAVNALIEIPRGSKVKYELDKPTGLLRVDRVLHSSVHYPANYGFIPRTYCGDGDPLDILVLCSESVEAMCIMVARPIGMVRMVDDGKADDKIIAVHVHDPAFNEYREIEQLPRHLAREIQRFFLDYKSLETKKDIIAEEAVGRGEAERVIEEAVELYRKEESRLRGWG